MDMDRIKWDENVHDVEEFDSKGLHWRNDRWKMK